MVEKYMLRIMDQKYSFYVVNMFNSKWDNGLQAQKMSILQCDAYTRLPPPASQRTVTHVILHLNREMHVLYVKCTQRGCGCKCHRPPNMSSSDLSSTLTKEKKKKNRPGASV